MNTTTEGNATRVKRNPAQVDNDDVEIKYIVRPEGWRFFAYLMFWLMCILATIFSTTLVTPYLAAGPEDGKACGPFNRDDPDFGVAPGEGFDFSTQSHLKHLFGFNNICANWDYSPSRELTAMFYPLFEYSLLVYLIFDFHATAIANKRGEIEPWFWKFSQVVFPICIFLCAQFRMIFVCIAYENVQQHTAGFLGLQIALILVAFHNAGFIWDSNIAYKQLGGPDNGLQRTRIGIVVYLIGQVSISIAKVTATIFVVSNGYGAPWTLRPVGSVVAGQVVDWIWMIFNAIIPLILAFFRSKNETPLVITVSQETMYAPRASTNSKGTTYMSIAQSDQDA